MSDILSSSEIPMQEKVGFQQKIIGKTRQKTTGIIEKVNPDLAWERLRKPQLLELFSKEGFAEPEQIVTVAKFLEESFKDEDSYSPYRITHKDLSSLHQLTDGIEQPTTFLIYLQNAVSTYGATLPEFGEFVDRNKQAPHLKDFLYTLPTIGPIKKLPFRYGEEIFQSIINLPDEEYKHLFTKDNLSWVRTLNLHLLDQRGKDSFSSTKEQVFSIEALPALLNIASDHPTQEMFTATIHGKEDDDLSDINTRAIAFAELLTNFPEISELYRDGISVIGSVAPTYISKESYTSEYKEKRKDIISRELSDEALSQKKPEVRAYWTFFRETLEHPEVSELLINKKSDPEFIQNGYPTSRFFDVLVETNSELVAEIHSFITPEIFTSFSPQEQKLWRSIKNIEQSYLSTYLLQHKEDIDSLIQDENPTFNLLNNVATENPELLSQVDRSLLSTIARHTAIQDQRFIENYILWNTVLSQQSLGSRKFLYAHKEQVKEYFPDNNPSREYFLALTQQLNPEERVNVISSDMERSSSIFASSEQQLLQYWKEVPETFQPMILEELPNFPFISEEEFAPYKKRLDIIRSVQQSPSREVRRLFKELSSQLWEVENPEATFAQVEDVFIKNNLPLVGKVYRVFEIIYDNPDSKEATLLEERSEGHASSVLREGSNRERRETIYKDLLRTHIESGNPSLKKFITVLQEGQQLVDTMGESDDVSMLSGQEQQQLHYFLDKMDTLYINSLFGRTIEERKKERDPEQYHSPSTHDLSLPERVTALKKNFRVRRDQTLTDRVAEMFVYPAGFSSLEEVNNEMRRVKEVADRRNRNLVEQSTGKIQLEAGDLLKGTQPQYLENILQNGSVAKEFLGGDSGSDATPLDTDVAMVLKEQSAKPFQEIVQSSLSNTYGDIAFILKDRGQFNAEGNFELFQTGVLGESHYGVRTGFPSTEIDAIIVKKPTDYMSDTLALTLARNNLYIPLVNTDGEVILSPKQFNEYRRIYSGVPEFSEEPMEMLPIEETTGVSEQVVQETREKVTELVARIREDEGKVDHMEEAIREKVLEVLAAKGIKLKDAYDTSIFGAQLLNTGSTGRHTNKPGDHDFDLSLLLDTRDMPQLEAVSQQLRESLHPTEDNSHGVHQEYFQIKVKGVQITEESNADIDIGVTSRADSDYIASHDVVEAKLQSMRETYGEERYYEVLANIVLAKQILAEGHSYKKVEGGFAGIGTENWILQNKGNFLEACRTFLEASYENGQRVALSEFKKRYPIFSAGMNIRNPEQSENFIEKLTDEGYIKFARTIEEYLQQSKSVGEDMLQHGDVPF